MNIISKITNFVRKYQNYIYMVMAAFIIEFTLFLGITIATAWICKFLFTVSAILFPVLISLVYTNYLMSKAYSEFAEKEYNLANNVNNLTFEHMGNSCKYIEETANIIKERHQNMSDLAEIYMSKNKSDMEYHNEQINNIMEALKIIAKELEKKKNNNN